jgi:hypothetical protein
MSNLNVETLRELNRIGVDFCMSIPGPGGQTAYYPTVEEVLLFEEDSERLYAKAHGLTLDQFREWYGNECSIVCSATTKAGRRCTNFVKGGYQVSGLEYLRRNGECCSSHAR